MERDLNDIWRNVLHTLEQQMNRKLFFTWFQYTAALKYENGIFIVGVSNVFTKESVENKFSDTVFALLQTHIPDIQSVQFDVDASLNDPMHPSRVELKPDPGKKARRVSGGKEVSFGSGLRSKALQDKYKLDSFIAGRNNRLPHAACQAVASDPGGSYNPLFIYGSVGLGKTHLLQGTGNKILRNFSDSVVVYVTSEQFVNEVVEGIRMRRMNEIKQKYRRADVLIVDDIQFLGEKPSSQDEFFHTFNDLYDAGKQILLSSDRPPKELSMLDERLRSRCGMGMVTEVLQPEYETRLAILQNKCQEKGVFLDTDILSCIAYHIEESVRDLEGVLNAVIARVQFEKVQPTVAMALEAIKQLHRAVEIRDNFIATGGAFPAGSASAANSSGPRSVFTRDLDVLLSTVARYFRISKADIVSEDRRREVLFPRQLCMYLLRKELDEAYEKIGADFGGKNHSTVLHACNKVSKMLETDPRVMRDLMAIKKELGLS